MTAITRDQRAKAWNVQFFADTDPIAGVYQHDNFLSIGDVARPEQGTAQYTYMFQTTIVYADVTLYPGDEAGGDPPTRPRLLAKQDRLLIANHRGTKTCY
ncbi:hypothetical protein F5883DRAFT_652914 [Diaporthe sp. PMI_573]|nr:hypothetical protein F5883DRAFT_652914 [Diaporthaceae sp. PMI_573]